MHECWEEKTLYTADSSAIVGAFITASGDWIVYTSSYSYSSTA